MFLENFQSNVAWKQHFQFFSRVKSMSQLVLNRSASIHAQLMSSLKKFKSLCSRRRQITVCLNNQNTLSGRIGRALVWHSEVAGSRLTQCSKSCDLQPALQCAIRGAQGALPCVGWGFATSQLNLPSLTPLSVAGCG